MRPPTHLRLVEKAAAAITSAVEVYNKPSFAYREETFAILALNAWELLLKAKVLKDAGNDMRSLRVYEPRKTKAGKPTKKLYMKRNRTGSPHTIPLGACITQLDKSSSKLPAEVKANLAALTAIRDNSVHFVTASPVLAKQAQELASASIKNFVHLSKDWFSRDLASALHLILPLSFVGDVSEAESVVVSPDESKLINYLRTLAESDTDSGSPFAVAVRMQVKLEKSSLASSSKVQISKDADAVKVMLSEQDIREKYPWDYRELCKRLAQRYRDFKQDATFHNIRKPLLSDERFAKPRYLDPGNPKSPKKDFYNPNVLAEFDQYYTKV
jgi:hypothetical protein